MFKFRYSYKYSSFSASLSKDVNTSFSPKSSIKLDTGASSTVLSIKSLLDLGLIEKENVAELVTLITKSNITASVYNSASGHILYGYPCKLKSIYLDNTYLDEFYFYVVLNDTLNINLLGNDFIRFCKVSKDIDDSFILSNLDKGLYQQRFESSLGNKQLLDINSLHKYKDLAAYFRNYYKEDLK